MYHFELKPARKMQAWAPHTYLEKEIEKFFDAFSKTDSFAPPCEVADEEKFYSVSLDIPGIAKEDLEIEVKENRLHVSGERKFMTHSDKAQVLNSERNYGKFLRVFNLPPNVNSDRIEAKFENGVLDIQLPKEEKSQSKKIVITDWSRKEDTAPEIKS